MSDAKELHRQFCEAIARSRMNHLDAMEIPVSSVASLKAKLLDNYVEQPGPLPEPCSMWTGTTTDKDGYGQFVLRNNELKHTVRTHRYQSSAPVRWRC
jgi:hypothetical protein